MPYFPSEERLRSVTLHGKEIVLVDYSNLKEAAMIELTHLHRDWVVTRAIESYFIANYQNTYATAEYMKAAYAFAQATKPFVTRGALLGIYGAKIALLRGVTYFMDVNFKAFDSEEAAVHFLLQ